MKSLFKLVTIASALAIPSMANASLITFRVQNQITTSAIDNTLFFGCANDTALLPSVAPGATSAPKVVGCGYSSSTKFEYASSDKKCTYTIAVFYDAQYNRYNPTGAASSIGAVKATCKILFAGADGNGNYGFVATML
ncbi:hypothetical protein U1708_07800 [Sphingomonas sp. ZB1N12]|uniref:hypothetical protein n=1 Tax=Sphingomonas arabinosi TaxID=3096160 RepID=UPI002FCBF290